MLDFFTISEHYSKQLGVWEIYPKFRIIESSDLMIRGRDFYAVWLEDLGLWSTSEQDVIRTIDRELDKYAKENKKKYDTGYRVLHMWDADTNMIDKWHKYCQKQARDSFHMLDEKLIFANSETKKEDYASKKLSYSLEEGDFNAWDKLISTLYSPEERHKIEWSIGSIVSGDSKVIQKFMVLYGAAGTGKSTILNIIQKLFDGYYSVFDAKSLGSSTNSFALESFKDNPLVAIQHDGDLSRIEDNTRLNSLVSHELMTVNEKFKAEYKNRFKCFLYMGTNKPVKITDAKSGLIRRLIDVSPSGNKVSQREYNSLMKQINFELGAIAYHCQEVYLSNPNAYDDYIPTTMLGATNDFYNFVYDSYSIFNREDGTTLKAAWEMYKAYCEEAKVLYPYPQKAFKEELKNYFDDYKDRYVLTDGTRVRSYYSGFRRDKFEEHIVTIKKKDDSEPIIKFEETESVFDKECLNYISQYATSKGTPKSEWSKVKTKLIDLDTSRLHYVLFPENSNHIVIDFDIPDETGNKCFEKNLEAASKWPPTYAELSKSGAGIHLHYIYNGDVSKLSRVYDDHIEIKVFSGKSSLRRKLTKCNTLPIATISSGLPLKGEKNVVNAQAVQSEKGLRAMIKRNLNKEFHPGTKPSIDFINTILNDAYESGLKYDVTDMRQAILAFGASSTHQSEYCIKLITDMKFKSEEPSEVVEDFDYDNADIVFYDVEVFPNLFLVNYKVAGEGASVVRLINPTPAQIEELMKFRLIGFNCRRYDNHILYARLMGYTNEELYRLSQRIIEGSKNCFFSEAYNVSYTDVYDFCSVKQSLKKWEIELGIHHQELGLPWDEPVPEELWEKVAEYCDNDVIATEAVFNERKADFAARIIQVELVKALHGIDNVSVNDTTNSLSTKIIFGNNRHPQSEFNYRDLSKPVPWTDYEEYREKMGPEYVFHIFNEEGLPTYEIYDGKGTVVLPDGWSIMPFFPKYRFERGKSYWVFDIKNINEPITNLTEDVHYVVLGEGGRVDALPGLWENVWDGDIASQHPHSAIAEQSFGPEYTKRFDDIVKARVAVKHYDTVAVGKLLNGVLKPFITDEEAADALAYALKIIINSIYGLSSASFENAFRDPRNVDNIIAKRGNLFMTLLKEEVEKLGYTVAHIKTDSIKIPNATKEIQDFVIKFGLEYGYTFETEANFDVFCLVNNAVYVAKYGKDEKKAGKWTPTGTQFAVPYVFKTMFSKEPITFEDMCETKAVVQGSIYLDMNENLPDVSKEEKEVAKLTKGYKRIEDLPEDIKAKVDALNDVIATGHDYVFVGRIGQFCPVENGSGGGKLMRCKDGKYFAVTGTKDYRWLESEMVKTLGLEDKIDKNYYRTLVDEAESTIKQYGDITKYLD